MEQDIGLQQQQYMWTKGIKTEEKWVGLSMGLVGTRENCSAQQPTYGTHMAFLTLVSKWSQRQGCPAISLSEIEANTFLQPQNSCLQRLTSLILSFESHDKKQAVPQNRDGHWSHYEDMPSRKIKISTYLNLFYATDSYFGIVSQFCPRSMKLSHGVL